MIKKILGKVKSKVTNSLKHKKYAASSNDYDANKYWNERHKTFSTESLKGVGINSKTEAENQAMYDSARYIYLGILNELIPNNKNIDVLEIGYGTGFYTQIMNDKCKSYTGVDIVDTHRVNILEKLNNKDIVELLKLNVAEEILNTEEKFDLIIMIDVTQHIVNDDKLIFNLKNNVQKKLKQGGIFITTDACKNLKISFYEKSRNQEFYENALNECKIEKNLVQFRDKYIFAFRKL